MKELATDKPLLIAVIGIPGAGKSTFAQKFSESFGAPIVETNLLRAEIFGSLQPSTEQQTGLERASTAIIAEMLKVGRTIIADTALNSYAKRHEVRAIAKKAGYEMLLVWVQTNEQVAQERAAKPRKTSNSHALTSEEHASMVAKFNPPHANEPHIVISGQHTFTAQIRPILKKIASRREPSQLPVPERRPPRRSIFIR